jgi:hypothetical protein
MPGNGMKRGLPGSDSMSRGNDPSMSPVSWRRIQDGKKEQVPHYITERDLG